MHLYSLFLQHPIICTDSRNCPAGSLFFALKGDNFNANAFALSALDKGCAYAVVDEAEYAIDERFILVDNALESLQALAHHHRLQMKATLVGITGTNGKTTTKELIGAVLKEKFNTLYTQGNLNNHIGVPLTLLQLTTEHEIAIIEMGANHPGDIKFLADIARPDYGIITNVGKAHLEGFGSFEGVKLTKAELYANIKSTGKAIFINADNEELAEMARKNGFEKESGQCIPYSQKNENNNCFGTITNCSPMLEMSFTLKGKEKFTAATQLIGSYNSENVLAAVCIGSYFGLSTEEIKRGLEKYSPQNNRSQLTITERNQLVVDAYNANPTSMRAAILNFAQMTVENKMLILGDMFELGEQAAHEHQEIVNLLQQNKLEHVLLIGNDFKQTQNTYLCMENVEELIAYLQLHPVENNFILLKGSRGMKMEKALPLL